jgi:hypothetical protein
MYYTKADADRSEMCFHITVTIKYASTGTTLDNSSCKISQNKHAELLNVILTIIGYEMHY